MKKLIIVFYLVIFYSSLAFAQNENKGTISATFGVGGGFYKIMEIKPQFSFIFDINFISKDGLTLSLTDIISVHSNRTSQNIIFSVGYTYVRDNWNIGGTIGATPTLDDLMLVGKINGVYYFNHNIGISSLITYRQTTGMGASSFSMFDVFLGASTRFF